MSASAAAAVDRARTCRVGAEKVVHHEVPEILGVRVAHEHVRARVVCPHEIRRHFTLTKTQLRGMALQGGVRTVGNAGTGAEHVQVGTGVAAVVILPRV